MGLGEEALLNAEAARAVTKGNTLITEVYAQCDEPTIYNILDDIAEVFERHDRHYLELLPYWRWHALVVQHLKQCERSTP